MIKDMNEVFYTLDKVYEKKILVIGDILMDEYVYGNVKHNSTGIKIPIIEKERTEYRLGGAANVAANIAGLCKNTVLLGRYANDDAGIRVKQLCREYGIKLIDCPTERTIVKQRIYVDNQQISRLDTNSYSESVVGILGDILNNEKPEVIILSDYLYGVITQDVIDEVAKYCRTNITHLFVTSRNINQFVFDETPIVVVNQNEWNEYTDNSKIKESFVTLGDKGISYISESETIDCGTEKKYPINVSGAGDTVLAVIATFYGELENKEILLKIANIAGELAVEDELTYVLCHFDLVDALYSRWTEEDSINKILSTDLAKDIIDSWKGKSEHIVFTNGCYDLLHLGHIKSFQYAKKYGEKLIVAVNSDESIRRLKGDGRPINSLEERACTLAYLSMIDMVVPFEEDTAVELIKLLKPDVYIKGSEYMHKELPEAEYAKRVEYLPMIEGTSTTQLINKIVKAVENNE